MEEGLPEDIENEKVSAKDEIKVRGKYLETEYGWDRELGGAKLWNFGPENAGPNLLVDATKGIQFMNEIRESCENAW